MGRYNGKNARSVPIDFSLILLGSEADIVICHLSHTHTPSLRRDLDFLYNRPRLNVAISRAKTISIVISSKGVLNPPVESLVSKENLDGFAYLKAYEDRAWSFEQTVGGMSISLEPSPSDKYFFNECANLDRNYRHTTRQGI